jgi:soluble lytic murein transglycosylase
VRAVLVALALASCSPARASETPLCDWFSGVSESAQALADGRPVQAEAAARRAAEARPHGDGGARAAAALGLALRATGAYADAADALEVALAARSIPARPYLAFARGESLLLAGAAPAAARSLEDAARDLRLALGRRAGFLQGRALAEAQLPTEAVSVLERLLERWPDDPDAPTARLELARARRAAGDEAGAVALLREVWLGARPPAAEIAGALLEEWRSAGVAVPAASADDRLTRAERFLADARPAEAQGELALAAPEEQPQRDRAQVLRATAVTLLGRLDEAARLADPLSRSTDAAVRRAAELVLARAAARARRVDEAISWYERVAASRAPIPGLPAWRQREIGDEAAYLAAWLPYDAGDYARAARTLAAFGKANPRSRRAEDALWFAAWSLVRLDRRADALQALDRLSRGPLGDAATYWRARLTARKRQRPLYERASALGGEGWYGLLARARLRELGAPAPRPPRPVARPLPETIDPASTTALSVSVELFGLGLEELGLGELRELAGSARARAAAPHLAQLAAFTGDAELPFRMARDHLGVTRRSLRWSHPEPHAELVEPAAAAAGLDPALTWAVMRRESTFRRAIRSNAGAEGLLQLRPETAERVATLLGLEPGVSAQLADPAINLPLGIHYLGLLAARFQDPAVALAGYNAGPPPAAEWARARAGMAFDEWVECVPFRETRNYLKLVSADWDVYRELEGAAPAPVDPARPVAAPLDGVTF